MVLISEVLIVSLNLKLLVTYLLIPSVIFVSGTPAESLCLSDKLVYALNAEGEVLTRYGIAEDHVDGDYWKKSPGCFKSIAGGQHNPQCFLQVLSSWEMNLIFQYSHWSFIQVHIALLCWVSCGPVGLWLVLDHLSDIGCTAGVMLCVHRPWWHDNLQYIIVKKITILYK